MKMESSSGGHNLPKIQVFRPTMDEFKDFPRFIEFIELQGAHKAGVAKIIPPKEWIPRKSGYDDIDLTIPAPILQSVSGNKGLYQQYNIQQKPIALRDFAKLANDDRHRTPRYNDLDELERKFWKNVTFNPPIYGADISGSLYDADQTIWNINRLGTILDRVSDEYSVRIEGVNTAYLYFGMWKTSFCWHTEDMDLYSINYLHYGAPKSWYAIPPEHGRRLERLAAGFFPNEAKLCPAFLRHKMTHISPHVLRRYSIPFNKITQEAGEFIITFPYSYHAGYNHGYNCAESTNFASLRWIEYGKRCLQCMCNSDMVHISMDCFIKNYQPERFELWKAGLDIGPHPEDDQRKLYPASSGVKALAGTELQARQAVDNTPSQVPDGSRSHKVSRRHPVIARLVPGKEEASKTQSLTMIGTRVTPDAADTLVKICNPYSEDGQKSWVPRKNPKHSHPNADLQTVTGESVRRKSKADVCSTGDMGIEVECLLQDVELNSLRGKNSIGIHELLQNALPLEASGCGYNVVASENSPVSLEVPSVSSRAKEQERISGLGHFSSIDNSLSVGRINNNGVKTLLRPQTVTSHVTLSVYPNGSNTHGDFTDKKGSVLAPSESVFPCPHDSWAGDTLLSASYCETFNIRSPLSDFKDGLLLVSEEALHEEQTVEVIDERSSSKTGRMADEGTAKAGLDALVSSETTHKRKTNRKLEKLTKDADHGKRKRKRSSVTSTDEDSVVSNIQKMCPQLAQVATLFQFLLEDWATEVDYNRKRSLVAPYCDVCSLFTCTPNKDVPESSDSNRDGMEKPCTSLHPMYSRPSIPEQLFAFGSEQLEKKSSTNQLGNGQRSSRELLALPCNESPLLVCCRCSVCVHASCYGELNVDAGTTSSWSCDWCLSGAFQDACCLCMLRGGAMKRTTTGQWSHITCALVISEVVFEDVPMRCRIRVESITAARRKLRCAYCLPLTSGQRPVTTHLGVCVQCTSPRCLTSFHVTCGWAAGACFTISSSTAGQQPITVTCSKHSQQKSNEGNVHRSVPPIELGEHVIAKHKNGRYYRCLVIGVHNQVFFRVEFEDGSFSDDAYPADIEWPSCSVAAPPTLGGAVKVRWSDGLLYNATFKGTNHVCLYQVQFEDGSVLTIERKDVWSEKEELPKKVALRLSVATETRHNLFQEDLLHKDTSSRTRSVQLRYIRDENFVNP